MGSERGRQASRDRSGRIEERFFFFTMEHSEGAQVVLLVASVEDVYPKVRSVQMPEY